MGKGILKILVGVILLLVVTSCLKNNEELVNDLVTEDKYVVGHTFDDGKRIHLTFDVPYNGDSLIMAFSNREISLNVFI